MSIPQSFIPSPPLLDACPTDPRALLSLFEALPSTMDMSIPATPAPPPAPTSQPHPQTPPPPAPDAVPVSAPAPPPPAATGMAGLPVGGTSAALSAPLGDPETSFVATMPFPTTDTDETGRVLREMRLAAMKRDMARNEGRTDLHKKLCPCPKCLSKLEEVEIANGHLRLVTHNTAVAHHKRWDELFSKKNPGELQSAPLFQPLFGLEPTASNISHVLHVFATRQGFPRGGRKRRFRSGSAESDRDFRPLKSSRTAVEAAAAAVSAAAAAAGHPLVPDESLSLEMNSLIEHAHAQPWLYSELVKLFRQHGVVLLDTPVPRSQPAPAQSTQQYPYPYNGAPGVPPPPAQQLNIFASTHQYAPAHVAQGATAHLSDTGHLPDTTAQSPPSPAPPPQQQTHTPSQDEMAAAAAAAAAVAAAAAAAPSHDDHAPVQVSADDTGLTSDGVPVPPNA